MTISVYAIFPIVAEDFNEFIEHFKREEDSLVIEENNIPIPIYEWPLNESENVNEGVLTHFEKHLLPNGFICDANVEIKIPVSFYKTYFGKVDAIVYNEKTNEKIRSAYISIEIDRSLDSLEDASNVIISWFKFIGMNIRSSLPVLHIRAGMETFK